MSAPDAAASTATLASAVATPPFRTFAETWLTNRTVEWRRSHVRVLRSTIDGHLVPHFDDKPIGMIGKADILALRNKLAEAPGRSGKGLPTRWV